MNDEVIAAGAQKVAYGGGAASLYGGMTANEIAAFGGLLIALLGLLVQLYFKHRSDKREQAYYAAKLAKLGDEDEYGDGGI